MKAIIKVFALLALFTQIAMMNIQLRKKAIMPEDGKTLSEKSKDKVVEKDEALIKKDGEKMQELGLNGTVKKEEEVVKNLTSVLPLEVSHRLDDDDDKNDIDYFDEDETDENYDDKDDDKDDKDTSKLEAFDEEKFKKEVDEIKKKAKLEKALIPAETTNSTTTTEVLKNTTLPVEEEKKKIVH